MKIQNKEPASQLEQLRDLAGRLADNLDEIKTPLVIEFSGTPKAGKTTCVDAISKFFRRHQIPIFTVTERASICPIADKTSPAFNIWTGCSSIAQLLESLERPVKIVIFDRGVFDTLVWMNIHKRRKSLPTDEFDVLESFLLRRRFTESIGIVAALSTTPEVSLQREFKDQITDIQGSVMNTSFLSEYNFSLNNCIEKYSEDFRQVIHIDTTNLKTVDGVARIAFEVLSTADKLVDEEIAVLDRQFVQSRIPTGGVLTDVSEMTSFLYEAVKQTKWIRRTEAEKNLQLVQIIPVATIRKNNEILVISVRGHRHGRLASHITVWAGGHVRRSDIHLEYSWATFRDCVNRELHEELKLPQNHQSISKHPNAIVWDNTNPRSTQHLALFYEYDGSSATNALQLREYYESPSKSMFTEFKPLDSTLIGLPNWESWSVLYLAKVHKLNFPIADRQALLL